MTQRENVMEMLKDIIGGEPVVEEPPRETEGFESLVSEEEFEAILKIKEAMDNFLEVHNKCAMEHIEDLNERSPYQRIQIMMLGDRVAEAQREILMMCGIHSCNKQFIDDLAEELGYTLKGLEQHLLNRKIESIFG